MQMELLRASATGKSGEFETRTENPNGNPNYAGDYIVNTTGQFYIWNLAHKLAKEGWVLNCFVKDEHLTGTYYFYRPKQ